MMCARLLRAPKRRAPGALGARARARASTALHRAATARALRFVLRHRIAASALVTLGTVGADGLALHRSCPRGCSRSRTPACSAASPTAPQDISFPAMKRAAGAAQRGRARPIPTSSTSISFIGGVRRVAPATPARCSSRSSRKPRAQGDRRRGHRPAAAQAGRGRRASSCSCRRCRTCASAAASRARSTSTRCRTPTSTSSTQWAPKRARRRCASCPSSRTSPPISRPPGSQLDVDDRSRHRGAARHHRARRSTTRSTTPSASARSRRSTPQLNQYRVVLEVAPALGTGPDALDRIYVRVAARRAGAAVGARQAVGERTVPLSVNHQGQFPAMTLSFNLAPGVALGQAVAAIHAAERAASGMPASDPRPTSRARRRRSRTRWQSSRC